MAFSLRDAAGLAATALAAYGRRPAEETPVATRLVALAICALLAVGFGLAALACGALALWLILVPTLGPLDATLIVAAILLACCLAMAWVTRDLMKVKAKPPARTVAPEDIEKLLGQGLELFKAHKSEALLAALVAGMVAGNPRRT